ncbi:type ISP restriction/modification enzyme [Campylobacter sp.]|uniref:type ISP restriction/modification enzyme n=1 Tax=Campylobacter sp. TaxID=205 RepID=UPI002A88A78E|nr:type ISP restriction/modification enzyme [Campylobacter sp.]MDY3663518.1 type ISP restriction/modification enzyme [Campylobacter sp.]MDY4013531.1 type ISP restriction/modification enzyme [Campylobacter sp.]MDY5285427.1 type ISP restriction/modification enzyme [Campylobacter sp.]
MSNTSISSLALFKEIGLSSNPKILFKPRFINSFTQKPTEIIYNDKVVINNIDQRTYDYVVNGKSAIAWVMKRYQVKTDEDSGITNDPNLYSDNPRYIIDLMMKVIETSLRSVELIERLPPLDILER